MASTASNFSGLFGAISGFVSALKDYLNNEPNSGQNLSLASNLLASSVGAIIANNIAFESAFGAFGVPAALASLKLDIDKFQSAKNDTQQTSAILGMAADGLGALNGTAAVFGLPAAELPAVDIALGTMTVLSADAAILKSIYDAGHDVIAQVL